MLRARAKRIYLRHVSVKLVSGPFHGYRIPMEDIGRTLTFSVKGQKGRYERGQWVPV